MNLELSPRHLSHDYSFRQSSHRHHLSPLNSRHCCLQRNRKQKQKNRAGKHDMQKHIYIYNFEYESRCQAKPAPCFAPSVPLEPKWPPDTGACTSRNLCSQTTSLCGHHKLYRCFVKNMGRCSRTTRTPPATARRWVKVAAASPNTAPA